MSTIYGYHVEVYYHRLRAIGLVRSRRDYSRRWLRRATTYMHDLLGKGREGCLVAPDTLRHLRERLVAVADLSPIGPASELRALLAEIDRDAAVVAILRRGRR